MSTVDAPSKTVLLQLTSPRSTSGDRRFGPLAAVIIRSIERFYERHSLRLSAAERMIDILEVITYMPAFYLAISGLEILQLGLASDRADRRLVVVIGVVAVAACIIVAHTFVYMQD